MGAALVGVAGTLVGTLVGVWLGARLDAGRRQEAAVEAHRAAVRSAVARLVAAGDEVSLMGGAFAAQFQVDPQTFQHIPERLSMQEASTRAHAAWLELRLLELPADVRKAVDEYDFAATDLMEPAYAGDTDELQRQAKEILEPARTALEAAVIAWAMPDGPPRLRAPGRLPWAGRG